MVKNRTDSARNAHSKVSPAAIYLDKSSGRGSKKVDTPKADRTNEQPTATVCSTLAASAKDGLTSCGYIDEMECDHRWCECLPLDRVQQGDLFRRSLRRCNALL